MVMHVVYDHVCLGNNVEVGDFVIIGIPPRDQTSAGLETRIGPDAVIRSHTVIYAGNVIGARFQTGHGAMIREYSEIGDDVSIGSHVVIEHHVRIDNRVRVHSNAFIPEYSILEEGAWVGPYAVFTNSLYPLAPNAKLNLKGPHVLPGAKIGANTTLLPGVVIGRNSLVGAGAVVVRDVPDGKVVVGNPARILRDVSELEAYQTDRFLCRRDDR